MTQSTDTSPVTAINPAEQQGSSPAIVSDVAVAQATAQAVREVPGVQELSSGRSVLAATYGAGRHVTGMVIHHPTPDKIRIEVHAVLSERYTRTIRLDTAAGEAGDRAQRQPVLMHVAEQIRAAVYRITDTLRLPALTGVDVFIDDLR